MEQADILVSVICCTYNHEPYIRQCLEGFMMQKLNFAFEILVHDDASTDKTADIIREYENKYPDIIKPIYQVENQYSKKVDIFYQYQVSRAQGKYIAICEGDDYWTDPLKLQKQVNLLEVSPEYGMCYTKSQVYNQAKGLLEKYYTGRKSNNPLLDIFSKGNFIPTLTTICRKDLILEYVKEITPQSHGWLMGDLPMWIWFIINSKIIYIDEATTVYRVLENSASHSTEIEKEECFFNSSKEIRLFFINKYPQYSYLRDDIYNGHYRTLLRLGEKYNCRRYCIDKIKKIKNLTLKEKIKSVLYILPYSISTIKNINTYKYFTNIKNKEV